ncbi:hybrid sensor histidine kinase/response regulator [Paraburkholderia acidisoli]|uniref:histidine kinase n=1 Tax=Paraburkholderia acidisoli TaxID=2571748 RepID=A0A7Z2JHD2_9BURK|nr:ATP-binding protein [Paraburkholderia acidisoli]QGZ65602.1 response regulator [Paraburkholderia acidisoli]
MEERILVVAPLGRDAQIVERVLARQAIECVICESIAALMARLGEGAACVLIVDEALDTNALESLDAWLSLQPPWSDLPFILLMGNGKKGIPTADGRRLQALGNVMLIERPVSSEALISAALSAQRARRRQYQARAMIAERAAANERLLAAARQKDDFLAMLAHELRNPLAPIRNAAELIRQTDNDLPQKIQWAAEMIARQSQHLSELLEDLMDVSRITTGKVTLKRGTVELGPILVAVADAARSALDSRCHTLSLHLPDAPVFLDADPTRMAQVFGNLLDNAAKYTPDGGQIAIRASVDAGHVLVSVEDNGSGIADDELPKIFELFSQSYRALDRAQGGLGIGLSVVRSLVSMHEGSVEAHSRGLGFGTTIRVRLPVLLSPGTSDSPARVEATQRFSLEVLVVDDNVDAADSLAALLEMKGHQTRTANDGPSALDQCKLQQPEVVLLDIGLPGMDGYEVARRLKAIPAMSAVKLVAITGYGQPEDLTRAKDAGFDHHLVKPVNPDGLMQLFKDFRYS